MGHRMTDWKSLSSNMVLHRARRRANVTDISRIAVLTALAKVPEFTGLTQEVLKCFARRFV